MNFNLINLKSNGKKKKNNEKFSKKKVLHAVGGRLRLDNCGNDLFNLELHTSFLANLFMRKILDFTHKLAKKSTFFNFDSFILGLKKKNIKYFLDLKFSSYLFNKNFNLSESISTHILERAVVLYAFKKKKK